MIFFTSDMHFMHNKDFIWRTRGFASVEDMNATLIQNWNNTVSPEDTVYCLGDVMLGDDSKGLPCVQQLQGHIYLIRGNHDTDRRLELYSKCPQIVSISNSTYLHALGYHFYLTHYPTFTSSFSFAKPLSQRLINLCGHSHITDPFQDWDLYRAPIYHCEVDAQDFTPVALDEIVRQMQSHFTP